MSQIDCRLSRLFHRAARLLIAICLLGCISFAAHAQKYRMGQEMPKARPGIAYPIHVHIFGMHYRTEYTGHDTTQNLLYLDAMMDGRKVELRTFVPYTTDP